MKREQSSRACVTVAGRAWRGEKREGCVLCLLQSQGRLLSFYFIFIIIKVLACREESLEYLHISFSISED